jgi:hypothetical protein
MTQNNDDQSNVELLKHDLAIKLEAERWKFRKKELQYVEAGQHLRALNQLLWQVPGLAIAITGGLWFGVTSLVEPGSKQIVFLFTAVVDALTVITLWRLRQIIQLQIDIQNQFSEYVQAKYDEVSKKGQLPNRTVITCWSAALLGATFISLLGVIWPPSFPKNENEVLTCCECDYAEKTVITINNNLIGDEKVSKMKDGLEKESNTSDIKEEKHQHLSAAKRKKVICKG